MFSKPASIVDRTSEGIEEWFAFGLGKLASADAGQNADAVFLEVCLLEVDSDIVRERDLGHSQILNLHGGRYIPGLSEIRVAEWHGLAGCWRLDKHAGGFLIRSSEIADRAFRFSFGGEHEMVSGCFPKFFECLMHTFRRNPVERGHCDLQIRLRSGKYSRVVDRASNGGGERL